MGSVPAGSVSLGTGFSEPGELHEMAGQSKECISRDCPFRRKGNWPRVFYGGNREPICWECRLYSLRSNPERERSYFSSSGGHVVPDHNRIADNLFGPRIEGRDSETLSPVGFPVRGKDEESSSQS